MIWWYPDLWNPAIYIIDGLWWKIPGLMDGLVGFPFMESPSSIYCSPSRSSLAALATRRVSGRPHSLKVSRGPSTWQRRVPQSAVFENGAVTVAGSANISENIHQYPWNIHHLLHYYGWGFQWIQQNGKNKLMEWSEMRNTNTTKKWQWLIHYGILCFQTFRHPQSAVKTQSEQKPARIWI